MTQVFLIKDKTDANARKAFVSIHKNEASAQKKLAQLRSRVKPHAQNLINLQPFEVPDFDQNKTSIYVIFNKTDKHITNPVVGMYSEFSNANAALLAQRKGVAQHAHKLVYVMTENLS